MNEKGNREEPQGSRGFMEAAQAAEAMPGRVNPAAAGHQRLVLISLLSSAINWPQLRAVSVTAICFFVRRWRARGQRRGLGQRGGDDRRPRRRCPGPACGGPRHRHRQLRTIKRKDKLWRRFQSCCRGRKCISARSCGAGVVQREVQRRWAALGVLWVAFGSHCASVRAPRTQTNSNKNIDSGNRRRNPPQAADWNAPSMLTFAQKSHILHRNHIWAQLQPGTASITSACGHRRQHIPVLVINTFRRNRTFGKY